MIVFKLGGSVLKRLHPDFFRKLRELAKENIPYVIVHGGGPFVSNWMNKLGQKPVFIKGRRVTDEGTLDIVQMVLAGQVNKQLVSRLLQEGIPALGISGIDLNLITVKPKDEKLGFVGEVTGLNRKVLHQLLESGWVPVLSSLGIGEKGQVFNVNADEAAASVAQGLGARKLVMVSDVDGIFIKEGNDKKLLRHATPEMVEQLISEGQITGGMIPKVRSAVRCLDGGVEEVWIINGEKGRDTDEKGTDSPGTCLVKKEVSERVSVSNL
jgi:acetylglutamate kinase